MKKACHSYPLLPRGGDGDDKQVFKVSMQYLIWLLKYVTSKFTLTFTLTEWIKSKKGHNSWKKACHSYLLLPRGGDGDDIQVFKVSMLYLIWLMQYVTSKFTLTFTLTEWVKSKKGHNSWKKPVTVIYSCRGVGMVMINKCLKFQCNIVYGCWNI